MESLVVVGQEQNQDGSLTAVVCGTNHDNTHIRVSLTVQQANDLIDDLSKFVQLAQQIDKHEHQ